ncbi:MAG: type II secretion system protein GspG [Candidatus Omnitrophica bacterium]|nr:type II secretion system protein GspG [Candidatus Omnitrophota bacterium]MBU4479655.1 type II secretion system protein GspG [Candidatus Omnitrophota bacterium]
MKQYLVSIQKTHVKNTAFTPLHTESSSFQTGDERQIKNSALQKPCLLGRGVTGFTLVELMVVVAIITILMGFIISGSAAAKRSAKIYQAKTLIASLETAIAVYQVDFGTYPESGNQNLVNSLADAATYGGDPNWHGPYMSFKENDLDGTIPNADIVDPWRNAYHYDFNEDNIPQYKIWSNGPDGGDDSGNADDIKSW